MVTVCTTHAAMHELFGSTPNFDLPVPDGDAPALGTISSKRVRATSIFDGWGYGSLFRRSAGKVERVDSYAIPEALDEDFAFGFGDLSIHEIAMNPNRNLAYSSYYAGGARVSVGASGIEEVGHFIDEGGNNFWGVETFISGSRASGDLQGKRLFAESDRDFGLYIFRYTGPRQADRPRSHRRGAARRPPLVLTLWTWRATCESASWPSRATSASIFACLPVSAWRGWQYGSRSSSKGSTG